MLTNEIFAGFLLRCLSKWSRQD